MGKHAWRQICQAEFNPWRPCARRVLASSCGSRQENPRMSPLYTVENQQNLHQQGKRWGPTSETTLWPHHGRAQHPRLPSDLTMTEHNTRDYPLISTTAEHMHLNAESRNTHKTKTGWTWHGICHFCCLSDTGSLKEGDLVLHKKVSLRAGEMAQQFRASAHFHHPY